MATTDQPTDAPDLAALLARLLPRLAELEEPILRAAGLSMWEYAIVTELADGEAMSQAELSRRVQRDPTRLGRHLEDLEARDVILREPAEDRRQRSVRLTPAGLSAFRGAKDAIRQAEEALLAEAFTPGQAASLRSQLERLARACTAS